MMMFSRAIHSAHEHIEACSPSRKNCVMGGLFASGLIGSSKHTIVEQLPIHGSIEFLRLR
jgi:hypothetical protein